MGITDGTKATNPAKPPPIPVINVDSDGCGGGGALPQMVITSVEGVDEEVKLKDVSGMQPSEEQVSEGNAEDTNAQSSSQQDEFDQSEKVVMIEEQQLESITRPVEEMSTVESPPKSASVKEVHFSASTPSLSQAAVEESSAKYNGCEEPKAETPQWVEDEPISASKHVSQSAKQRPLRIESSEAQSSQPCTQSTEASSIVSEASKSGPQSATQRPLVFDAEAARMSEKSVAAAAVTLPESIYEIIEPKEECSDSIEEKKDIKVTEKSKEADGFFAKSKTFFKHDSKHKFTFPKFTFGSKEHKELKSSKKQHETPKPEDEETKESRKQEYSVADAAEAAAKDENIVIEKYKKLNEDAIFAETIKPVKSETQKTAEVTQKSPITMPTSSRAALIHPVTTEPSSLSMLKMKAEEENFDLEHPKEKPGDEKRASTPESLYDTCCLKLASLIRHKALEIATDVSKSAAPKKPPKPTPDALARARAAVASKRLQELESRHRTFGENIPVGFGDLRYADDDTESSNDYKDVENFGVIMNPECYGIIRKMKMDNKSDSFRASSTCSGMSSYYTADSATLKGENSSDNTLETVSLGSCESIICRPSSLPTETKDVISATSGMKDKVGQSSVTPVSSKRSAFANFFSFPSKKKVPPPVPPKPAASSTKTSPELEETQQHLSRTNAKDVARCVNSLSLSPRPVHKTPSNGSAGIRRRPLTIVGIKDAEMILDNRNKSENESKVSMSKSVPISLVRNDSPKPMRNLPIAPTTPSKPLSHPSRTQEFSPKPKAKPEPPPRPPPPSVSSPQKISGGIQKPITTTAASHGSLTRKVKSPPLSPKPKIVAQRPPMRPPPSAVRKSSSKQLVSPPRPSPPAAKPAIPPNKPHIMPPPRPPPPAAKIKLQVRKSDEQSSNLDSYVEPVADRPLEEMTGEDLAVQEENSKHDLHAEGDIAKTEQVVCGESSESKMSDSKSVEGEVQSDRMLVDSVEQFDGNLQHSLEIESDLEEVQLRERQPRPPPRTRRIRSKTVEIVPVTEKVPSLRRSQSLSDTDIEKRKESEKISPPSNQELKHIYTTIQKDPSKAKNGLSTPEDMRGRRSPSIEGLSSRPLPPPPLPPRSKSRSSSRRSKSDERPSSASLIEKEERLSKSESMPSDLNGVAPLKPPSRKKKGTIHKFATVSGKSTNSGVKNKAQFFSLRVHKNTGSPPVRPERRAKYAALDPVLFDENANVTAQIPDTNVTMTDTSLQDISPHYATPVSRPRGHSMGSGMPDTSEQKGKSSQFHRSISETPHKSHSTSWYDEEIGKSFREGSLDDTWEKVDWLHDRIGYAKPKATPPRKKKQSSKFYVDVPHDDVQKLNSQLPLSDASQDFKMQTTEASSEETSKNQLVCADSSNASKVFLPERTAPPPPPAATPTADKETSPLPLSCSEKSVQTSLETLSVGRASRSELSDDTDDLLDLAQTLQKELKTIITRHKVVEKSDEESASTSEAIEQTTSSHLMSTLPLKNPKLPNSSTSSSSDLWQISSSEESEDEPGNPDEQPDLSDVLRAKKLKKTFYIAQEIMSSEETFVDCLKLLNVDFRSYILEANKQRGSPVVPDEIINQILNHLPQLQHLNENLLMELKDRIENWEKIHKIADVIVKMGPFLKLFSWYIQDFEATLALLEESKKKYQAFGQCVREFEMSPRCQRLRLNFFMLKPVQRLPQYRLLLQEYLHHLVDDSPDREDTVEALRIVSDVANHANERMKEGDNMQKLISIQNSIMGHREIIKPGRMFLKEGELMKLSRKGMQPRWFVLFNDLLLYLTPVQQGLYRINHELTLAGMKVAIPIQQDYQNEFSIISVTRSFTLAAKSPEERQEWIIALTKAIEENASKRSTFTNVRIQQKSQESAEYVDDDGFVLGKKAPVWIPDARVTMCQLCTSEFTVTFRRHHCRACGKVVCSICSSNRISLQYLGNRIARVCDECYGKLGQGSTACTESGETDSDNQQIAVKTHLRTDHWHHKKKRQLPSVLKEVCANDKGSTISGYIHKRISNKSWKRNWFVVKDKVLYEYRASEDVAALRSIPLLGFQINTFTEPYEGIDASLVFELSHPGRPPIYFHADTPGFAERWIKELRDATVLE